MPASVTAKNLSRFVICVVFSLQHDIAVCSKVNLNTFLDTASNSEVCTFDCGNYNV